MGVRVEEVVRGDGWAAGGLAKGAAVACELRWMSGLRWKVGAVCDGREGVREEEKIRPGGVRTHCRVSWLEFCSWSME